VFRLYDEYVPKTAANFRALCEGKAGSCQSNPAVPLAYKGSSFHRIIRDFMCQGGDFTAGNGTGGESIYGRKFPDESFRMKHNKAGLLSMANSGPNTNGSQFFIIFRPVPHLDGKHVVFGEIVDGMPYLKAIENVRTDSNDRPLPGQEVIIVDCGIIGSSAAPDNRPTKRRAIESPIQVPSDDDDAKKMKKKKEKKEKKEKKSKDKKSKKKKAKKRQRSSSSGSSSSEVDPAEAKVTVPIEQPKPIEKKEPPAPRIGADGTVYKGRGAMKYVPTEQGRHPGGNGYHRGDRRPERLRSRSRDRHEPGQLPADDTRDRYRRVDDYERSPPTRRDDSRDRDRGRDRPRYGRSSRDMDDDRDRDRGRSDRGYGDRGERRYDGYSRRPRSDSRDRRRNDRETDPNPDRSHHDAKNPSIPQVESIVEKADYAGESVQEQLSEKRSSRFNVDPRAAILAHDQRHSYAKSDLDYRAPSGMTAAAEATARRSRFSDRDDKPREIAPPSPLSDDRRGRRRYRSSSSSESSSSSSSSSSGPRHRRRRSSSSRSSSSSSRSKLR
jgi:peptidyl-prolyl isomerase G (cyclophilin G)